MQLVKFTTNLGVLRRQILVDGLPMSQVQLGEASGIHRSTINFLEQGYQEVTRERARRLAVVLKVKPSEITCIKLDIAMNAQKLFNQASKYRMMRIMKALIKLVNENFTFAQLTAIVSSIALSERRSGIPLNDLRFVHIIKHELAKFPDSPFYGRYAGVKGYVRHPRKKVPAT